MEVSAANSSVPPIMPSLAASVWNLLMLVSGCDCGPALQRQPSVRILQSTYLPAIGREPTDPGQPEAFDVVAPWRDFVLQRFRSAHSWLSTGSSNPAPGD